MYAKGQLSLPQGTVSTALQQAPLVHGNLETRGPWPTMLLTLIALPLNSVSFISIAFCTSSGSANSTYAYPFG